MARELSSNLKYHVDNRINLSESVFRIGSNSFVELFAEARRCYEEDGSIELSENDRFLIEETDIGFWGECEDGSRVPLDVPMHVEYEQLNEEDEKLNVPRRGGKKKYYVYVRNPKTGRAKRVEFGYPGMSVRTDSLEASKNFAARHKCSEKKDRTQAGWWSCNLPRYAKLLGLSEPAYRYW